MYKDTRIQEELDLIKSIQVTLSLIDGALDTKDYTKLPVVIKSIHVAIDMINRDLIDLKNKLHILAGS